ncbi:MAG TPA: hypothetical protein VIU29_07270 [Candidatus Deferrimicrobiaceae bacterium]
MRPRRLSVGAAFAIAMIIAMAGCGGGPPIRRDAGPEGVSFVVSPSDAEVLIDNIVRGKASDFPDDHPLKIVVGVHLLELRAPDHVPYIRTLAVSPRAKRIEATLLRSEGAAPPEGRGGNGGGK